MVKETFNETKEVKTYEDTKFELSKEETKRWFELRNMTVVAGFRIDTQRFIVAKSHKGGSKPYTIFAINDEMKLFAKEDERYKGVGKSETIIIGRGSEANERFRSLFRGHDRVSRKHIKLSVEDGKLSIENLGRNGTVDILPRIVDFIKLNGQPHVETELAHQQEPISSELTRMIGVERGKIVGAFKIEDKDEDGDIKKQWRFIVVQQSTKGQQMVVRHSDKMINITTPFIIFAIEEDGQISQTAYKGLREGRSIIIGRGSEANERFRSLFRGHDRVSRKHIKLSVEDGKLSIENLGKNGTEDIHDEFRESLTAYQLIDRVTIQDLIDKTKEKKFPEFVQESTNEGFKFVDDKLILRNKELKKLGIEKLVVTDFEYRYVAIRQEESVGQVNELIKKITIIQGKNADFPSKCEIKLKTGETVVAKLEKSDGGEITANFRVNGALNKEMDFYLNSAENGELSFEVEDVSINLSDYYKIKLHSSSVLRWQFVEFARIFFKQ